MDQFFQFVINHWLLWLLLVAILGILIFQEMSTQIGGVRRLSPQDVLNLINHQQAVVVDIRENDAYQSGHILNAINMPFKELEGNLNKLQKYKTKPIVLVCGTGQTAIKAGMLLKKNSFEHSNSMHGGLTAWQQANLPLVTENKKPDK